jgi:hypothetical protein
MTTTAMPSQGRRERSRRNPGNARHADGLNQPLGTFRKTRGRCDARQSAAAFGRRELTQRATALTQEAEHGASRTERGGCTRTRSDGGPFGERRRTVNSRARATPTYGEARRLDATDAKRARSPSADGANLGGDEQVDWRAERDATVLRERGGARRTRHAGRRVWRPMLGSPPARRKGWRGVPSGARRQQSSDSGVAGDGRAARRQVQESIVLAGETPRDTMLPLQLKRDERPPTAATAGRRRSAACNARGDHLDDMLRGMTGGWVGSHDAVRGKRVGEKGGNGTTFT